MHIKKTITLASLIGLIALLLFSPCKVRNSVQSALEMPQTEVSSKSVCQVYEDMESLVSVTKTIHQNAPANIRIKPQLTSVAVDLSRQLDSQIQDKSESVNLIPYYILYQNLKVHI